MALLSAMTVDGTAFAFVGFAAGGFATAYIWVNTQIDKKVLAVKSELSLEIETLRLRVRYLEHSDRSIRQMMITYAADLIDGGNPDEVAKKLMAGATHYDEIKP